MCSIIARVDSNKGDQKDYNEDTTDPMDLKEHYQLSKTTQNPFHIGTWLINNPGDLALKVCHHVITC